jgi:3-oxoadipate enol-lactonase
MSTHQSKTGYVNIDNANLYYEVAGVGTSLVMVHAGVADSRQWGV